MNRSTGEQTTHVKYLGFPPHPGLGTSNLRSRSTTHPKALMKKHILLIATLLAALCGSVQAQSTTSNDPIVQMRTEQRAVDKTYSDKKKALDSQRKTKVKAAGDEAAAAAKAKGGDPAVARRSAESKVKSATKGDYDTELKAAKKERDTAKADIKKKYPNAKG